MVRARRRDVAAGRASELAEELWALHEGGHFCDVAIVAGTKERAFFAHQVVLATATPALRGFFAGQQCPSPAKDAGPALLSAPPRAQELQLRDCAEAEAVKAVLDRAYLRQVRGPGTKAAKQTSPRHGGRGRAAAAAATAAATGRPAGVAAEAADLANRLQAFRSEGFLCDLVITVAGTNTVAHQAVLAAASPSFREYALDSVRDLGSGSSGVLSATEASVPPLEIVQPLEMELEGISHAEALHVMLDYVYASLAPAQWPQTIGAMRDVLTLSEAFELPALAREARAWLHSHGALQDAAASDKHSPLKSGLHRSASIASITRPTQGAQRPTEVGHAVVAVSTVLMREGEEISSQPLGELAAGTKCIILANGHSASGQRVRARVVETGREGWLSRVSKAGTTLLEPATSDAASGEAIAVAHKLEVGSVVDIVSKVLMREGEDLSSRPVVELASGTKCVVLGHGHDNGGQRVRARVIGTGSEGWLSCVGKGGTTLLEPGTSGAAAGEIGAGARAFEVGSTVATVSRAMMRDSEDLSSRALRELPPGILCTVLERGRDTTAQRVRARILETGQEGWLSAASRSGTVLLAPAGRAAGPGQQQQQQQQQPPAPPPEAPGLGGAPAVAAPPPGGEQAEDATAPSTPPARASSRAAGRLCGGGGNTDGEPLTPKAVKRPTDVAADSGGRLKLPRTTAAGAPERAACGIS